MADRRKRILNRSEKATEDAIRDVAEEFGARVLPKVRIADVYDITNSGISNQEYTYALQAHFDIVVARDELIDFAIEFDGPVHDEFDARKRDRLKDSLCERFGIPLLRIESDQLVKIGQNYLLGWLVRLFYMKEAFEKFGPEDEDFCFYGWIDIDPRASEFITHMLERGEAEFEGKLYMASDPESFEISKKLCGGKYSVAMDPFSSNRHFLFVKSQPLLHRIDTITAFDQSGRFQFLSIAYLRDGTNIIGLGTCKPIRWAVSYREVAEELAFYDCAERLRKHLNGEKGFSTPSVDLERWRSKFLAWSGADEMTAMGPVKA